MMRIRGPSLGLLALLLAPLAACRITPEEIQRIEVENELLRKEIQTIREQCEYYNRELKIERAPDAASDGKETDF